MKIKPDKIYKVEWVDIASQANIVIRKPYNQYLVPSSTIGYVRQDKDTVLVIYSSNYEGQDCFDSIPRKIVKKITPI